MTSTEPRIRDDPKKEKFLDYPKTIFSEHEKYEWKELKKTNEDKLPKKYRNGWK